MSQLQRQIMSKVKDLVKIKKSEFVKEHKNLLKVLKSKNRKDDKTEYKKQSKELKGVLNAKS